MTDLKNLSSLVTLIVVSWPLCLQAVEYVSSPDESSLIFYATQQKAEFQGAFNDFTATVDFDPSSVAEGKIEAEIILASVDTMNPERDGYLLAPEWFDTQKFPRAYFVTTGIKGPGDGMYRADSTLSMKNVIQPVEFSFIFESNEDGTARLQGEAELKRTDFGIGQGDWADTTWVGDEVFVKVDLLLLPTDNTGP